MMNKITVSTKSNLSQRFFIDDQLLRLRRPTSCSVVAGCFSTGQPLRHRPTAPSPVNLSATDQSFRPQSIAPSPVRCSVTGLLCTMLHFRIFWEKATNGTSVCIVMEQMLRLFYACGMPMEDVDFYHSDEKTKNKLLLENWSKTSLMSQLSDLAGRRKLDNLTISPVLTLTITVDNKIYVGPQGPVA